MWNVKFEYKNSKIISGLTTYYYTNTKDLMDDYIENPENLIYDSKYSGLGNSTAVYKAPIFVSKGHYGDIWNSAFMVPDVVDSNK